MKEIQKLQRPERTTRTKEFSEGPVYATTPIEFADGSKLYQLTDQGPVKTEASILRKIAQKIAFSAMLVVASSQIRCAPERYRAITPEGEVTSINMRTGLIDSGKQSKEEKEQIARAVNAPCKDDEKGAVVSHKSGVGPDGGPMTVNYSHVCIPKEVYVFLGLNPQEVETQKRQSGEQAGPQVQEKTEIVTEESKKGRKITTETRTVYVPPAQPQEAQVIVQKEPRVTQETNAIATGTLQDTLPVLAGAGFTAAGIIAGSAVHRPDRNNTIISQQGGGASAEGGNSNATGGEGGSSSSTATGGSSRAESSQSQEQRQTSTNTNENTNKNTNTNRNTNKNTNTNENKNKNTNTNRNRLENTNWTRDRNNEGDSKNDRKKWPNDGRGKNWPKRNYVEAPNYNR